MGPSEIITYSVNRKLSVASSMKSIELCRDFNFRRPTSTRNADEKLFNKFFTEHCLAGESFRDTENFTSSPECLIKII